MFLVPSLIMGGLGTGHNTAVFIVIFVNTPFSDVRTFCKQLSVSSYCSFVKIVCFTGKCPTIAPPMYSSCKLVSVSSDRLHVNEGDLAIAPSMNI